jgi:hypothetical protein
MRVEYAAQVQGTPIPGRYAVVLFVEGIPTGIQAHVWGRKKATAMLYHMVNHGNEIINQHGMAAHLAAQIYTRRREEAMAKVKVGDTVKLLVDIGPFKTGRVCKVAEVYEPSFYEVRGAKEFIDEDYPVKVLPVRSPLDTIALGPKDFIPLRRGEFGPLNDPVMEGDE